MWGTFSGLLLIPSSTCAHFIFTLSLVLRTNLGPARQVAITELCAKPLCFLLQLFPKAQKGTRWNASFLSSWQALSPEATVFTAFGGILPSKQTQTHSHSVLFSPRCTKTLAHYSHCSVFPPFVVVED